MALFNSSFPATYQQPYYQPSYHNSIVPSQNNNNTQLQSSGIIWVQGEAGAKSYLVAPNTTVALWDAENPVIYLKSADASGMPSIKQIDYTVRENGNTNNSDGINFATKDDVKRIEDRIAELKTKIDNVNSKEATDAKPTVQLNAE